MIKNKKIDSFFKEVGLW